MSASTSTYTAGFDTELAAVMVHEATISGETVQLYIQRAVAARMVADLSRRNDPTLSALHSWLTDSGLEVSDVLANNCADEVITNPDRVAAVHLTGLLDSTPNAAFERVLRMATEALGIPSASLTLIDRDRLFILSSVGVAEHITTTREFPLRSSITRSAIAAGGHTVVVENASTDPKFTNLPFVRDRTVVSYLGIPLISPDGYPIGILAVWDRTPRHWSTGHIDTLHTVARLVWQKIFGTPDI